MPGSISTTHIQHTTVKKLTLAWTCDASGNVSGVVSPSIAGEPLRVVTIPDGTDVPTASYDITLDDQDGADVLRAQAANRSATATEQLGPGDTTPPLAFSGTLELKVSNAGNAKKGQLIIYYR